MRRNSHTHTQILNESDFPYTADEILEQIDNARTDFLKIVERNIKDFRKSVVKEGERDIRQMQELSHYIPKIIILNDARIMFEMVKIYERRDSPRDVAEAMTTAYEAIKAHWWRNDRYTDEFGMFSQALYELRNDYRTPFLTLLK